MDPARAPLLLWASVFACLAPAWPAAAAGSYDADAAAIVVPRLNTLNQANQQVDQASIAKARAGKDLQNAQAKLERSEHMWLSLSKSKNKAVADMALRKYQQAVNQETALENQRLAAAADYVESENTYHNKTGGYYDYGTYSFWKDRLGSGAQTPQDKNKDLDSRVQNASQEMLKPVKSLGELMDRGRRLSTLGDDVLIDKSKAINDMQLPDVKPLDRKAAWGESGSLDAAHAGSMSGGGPADFLNAKVLLSPKRDETGIGRRADKDFSAALDRISKGDRKGALQDLDRALARNPKDAELWAYKAATLDKLRRWGEAEQAARKALELDPSNADARKSLMWSLLHQKKYEEARRNADLYIQQNPDDPQGYLMRAFAYEGMGQRDKMLADLEKAASLDPRYKGHLALAKAGQRLFNPDAADTDSLLDGLTVVRVGRPVPYLLLGGVFLLLALGAGVLLLLRKELKAPRTGPSAAAAKALAAKVPPARPPAAVGSKLAGKYELLRLEHENPSVRVWCGRDPALDRLVLIKQLLDAAGEDPARAREARRKEARTLAALHDPRIVDIYEFLDLPSGFFWVLELSPGRSLRRILLSYKHLPWAVACRVFLDAAGGVAVAHAKGLHHGNLRPETILVTDQGAAKVMDFSPDQRPQSNLRFPYAAPEDAAGPAADVYSLGVCLYETLAGHVFESRVLPTGPMLPEGADAPEGLDALLKAALEPSLAKRLPDAAAFAARLQDLPRG